MAQAVQDAYGFSLKELEQKWKKHLRLRYNLIPFLTGSSLLWVLIIGVLFWSYAQRKRRARRIMQQWEEEEGWQSDLKKVDPGE